MEFIGDAATLDSTDLLNLCEAMYDTDKNPDLKMSKRQCLALLIDISKKLRTLHKYNVIVNDIKLDNILIHREQDTFIPYFIDFSHAALGIRANQKVETNDETIKKYMKDHKHVAPEWFLHGRVHRPSDVYAMGLVFLQMGQIWEIPDLMHLGTLCRSYESDKRPNLRQIFYQLIEMYNNFIN